MSYQARAPRLGDTVSMLNRCAICRKPLRSRYISVLFCASELRPASLHCSSVFQSDQQHLPKAIPKGSPQDQHLSEYRSLAVMRNAHIA